MLHKVENRLKKKDYYENLSREWTTHHTSELIIRMGDLSGHVGRNIDRFQGMHGEFSIGERNQDGGCCLDFVMHSACASPTHRLERLTRKS